MTKDFLEIQRRRNTGGDSMQDFQIEIKEDKFHRAANQVDGAMSILTGVAANKSIASGLPVQIDDLVKF